MKTDAIHWSEHPKAREFIRIRRMIFNGDIENTEEVKSSQQNIIDEIVADCERNLELHPFLTI